MKNDFAEYEVYLKIGIRVEIGIPLAGGGVFRDWAIINEYRGDEVVTQISRDVLPANVKVEVGTILDLSVWVETNVYTCSCIVTEKLGARVLRIRLFGSFQLQERRQFFRLGLDIRVKFAVLQEQNRDLIQRDWELRKELEHMKFQGYDRYVIAAHSAQYPPPLKLDWLEILSPSSNLGGGGMRLRFPQRMRPEELVQLEIHLPVHPPRLIFAVAQVIHVLEPKAARGRTDYPAGVQFVHLDERDRDLLFQVISVQQIEYLRKLADGRAEAAPQEKAPQPVSWQRIFMRSFMVLLLLVVSFYLVRYFIHYHQKPTANEIGTTYEKALKHYRGMDE